MRRCPTHPHAQLHPAVRAELLPQVIERRGQPEHVELRGPQPVRDVAHLAQRSLESIECLCQGRRRGNAQLCNGRLQQQLDRHQRLARAVVQFTGEVSALGLLRLHHLAREQPQLGVRNA